MLGPEKNLVLSPWQLRAAFTVPAITERTLTGIAGQERARTAIAFGLAMSVDGYNIAVSGAPQSGRNRLLHEELRPVAASQHAAPDWVYVFNFADPRRPRAISMPAGVGDDLQRAMAALVEVCRTTLPAAFASDSYEGRLRQVLAPIEQARQQAIEGLQALARGLGFAVNATPMGLLAAPLKADGTPMQAEEFAALAPKELEPLEERGAKVQEATADALRAFRRMDADARERVVAVDREVTRFVIGPLLDEAQERFGEYGLESHLKAIEANIGKSIDVLKRFAGPILEKAPPQMVQQFTEEREALLLRYGVNLFVTHGDDGGGGAPIIDERHPTYHNLFGRAEFENRMGTLVTDFLHIRPGAIHLANGGYLCLQAQELFSDPRAWPRLKNALMTHEVRFDDPSEGMPFSVVNLAPEGIPLSLKVILIGPPMLFAVLDYADPEFAQLFKVRAEFEPDTPADAEAVGTYTAFISQTQEECGLRVFQPEAVAAVLEHGTRLAGRQDRLTTQLGLIADLCHEANHFASAAGHKVVSATDIRAAERAREERLSLLPDRVRQLIVEGTLRIDTKGTVEGQVNGLAVFSMGGSAFGAPTRITCRTSAGRLGIIDIERETERSGAIHSKGVLVLAGYLSGTFGRLFPLAFNASLTFEQSYDEVEGDSASSAELYAILTSLAGVAVRQDIAVTGSVDQLGNIQAVGGVTHKVEGFFDVCVAGGLTGTQGVMLPAANIVNLTLRDDIVAAVSEGRFHLWAIHRVEEGLEILTGLKAGEEGAFGTYPGGTIFARVASTLEQMRVRASEAEAIARPLAPTMAFAARRPPEAALPDGRNERR